LARTTQRKNEDVDAALTALDSLPTTREARVDTLRAALSARHYRIVAKAARLAEEALLYELAGALVAAYPRFLDKAVKADPNCIAKRAILHALVALDHDDAALFVAALRYRQPEPVWGGTRDTAAELRAAAAMGLVASGYPRALAEVAELLADAEADARLGALRAIACGQPREAEPLLRAKAAAGDAEPAVLGECFTALLAVEPEESVAFVARFLEHADEAVAEHAALALGESRAAAALEPLRAAWGKVLLGESMRRTLLRAAAAHRSEAALEWLLAIVAEARAAVALEGLEALEPYKHNAKLAARLEATLAERGDPALMAHFAESWPQG
jgi:hypothetical protein